MKYSTKAAVTKNEDACLIIKKATIPFGTTEATATILANPAELFLGSIAACILKNVERFSNLLKFRYNKADITVKASRTERPPSMEQIEYELVIYSKDDTLNTALLKKNFEKYGTIYNTVIRSCEITGTIKVVYRSL